MIRPPGLRCYKAWRSAGTSRLFVASSSRTWAVLLLTCAAEEITTAPRTDLIEDEYVDAGPMLMLETLEVPEPRLPHSGAFRPVPHDLRHHYAQLAKSRERFVPGLKGQCAYIRPTPSYFCQNKDPACEFQGTCWTCIQKREGSSHFGHIGRVWTAPRREEAMDGHMHK